MLQLSKNVYFKILKSPKTFAYISLNVLLSCFYFIVEYLKNRNIKDLEVGTDILLFRDYKVVSIFGNSVYFITLGILLWFLILLEIMKYFRVNNDSGILLTHISRSYQRMKYFFAVLLGIFTAFVTVVTINILLSYLTCVVVYKFSSVALFKMALVGIVYGIIHILIIIIILTFFAIIIKQTEISIIASVFFILVSSFIIFFKSSIGNMELDSIGLYNTLVAITHADSYFYITLTRNVFLVFNEKLALDTQTTIDFFNIFKILNIEVYDPDLNFKFHSLANIRRLHTILLTGTIVFNAILFSITCYIFKKMDIAGN